MVSHPGWSLKSLACHKKLFLLLLLSWYQLHSLLYWAVYLYQTNEILALLDASGFLHGWFFCFPLSMAPWTTTTCPPMDSKDDVLYSCQCFFHSDWRTCLFFLSLLSFSWLDVVTHHPWLCWAAVPEALFHIPSLLLFLSLLRVQIWTLLGCWRPGSWLWWTLAFLLLFLNISLLHWPHPDSWTSLPVSHAQEPYPEQAWILPLPLPEDWIICPGPSVTVWDLFLDGWFPSAWFLGLLLHRLPAQRPSLILVLAWIWPGPFEYFVVNGCLRSQPCSHSSSPIVISI